MDSWPQWARANADKLLLLLAAFAFMIYGAHFAHRGLNNEVQNEMERTALGFAGQAFAGFLALTQAGRLAASLVPNSKITQSVETHQEPVVHAAPLEQPRG